MELALVVYLIGVLPNLSSTFDVIAGIMIFIAVIAILFLAFTDNFSEFCKERKWSIISYIFVWFSLVIGSALIPSEKTMYMMAGAYATQQVYQSEEAKKLGTKLSTLINKKLEQYINDIDLEDKPKKELTPNDKSV